MRKILIVFGTRPEAIKMAPLVKALQQQPEKFRTLVCVTGQHREMLDQVLRIFAITPEFDLDIMRDKQDLTDITSRVLHGMRSVIATEQPDIVLVHGDTTTSMAAALAAFYQQVPVGHVEAGLRTYDIFSPWPEEMNRQITGRIARWNFAPTEFARHNLLQEAIPDARILVTGNTVIDALHWVLDKMRKDPQLPASLALELQAAGIPAERLAVWSGCASQRRLVLITGHRRENFGEGFVNICEAIRALALQHPEVDFVYPMHLNPNVRMPIRQVFGDDFSAELKNVFFIEPLQYLPFVF